MPSNDPVGEFFRDVFGSDGTSSGPKEPKPRDQPIEQKLTRFTPCVIAVLVGAVIAWWAPTLLTADQVAGQWPQSGRWAQWLIEFRSRLVVAVVIAAVIDLVRFLRWRQRRILAAVVRQTTGHNATRIQLSWRTGWHSTHSAKIRIPLGSVVDELHFTKLDTALNALIVGEPYPQRVRAKLPIVTPALPERFLLRRPIEPKEDAIQIIDISPELSAPGAVQEIEK
ncbi:hypothetical protein HG717_37495 [Rhodococcus erythropolis]|jgi:hypothetical protein|uniref:hypothetical protein n=1 Tax=Rhodococcus TaxID=1827 RepID=UPI001AE95B21|nr:MULTISPECIES: hypothetical protein [Rhodococcus]MBP2520970.1 hypothetical protein [Rhodococcus sp. PvP104]MBY6382565.1 hypothetical protein [Rhodococcus erythropolis]MBY6389563.1 hypothetical protein [Rhodococcus erythropolis]